MHQKDADTAEGWRDAAMAAGAPCKQCVSEVGGQCVKKWWDWTPGGSRVLRIIYIAPTAHPFPAAHVWRFYSDKKCLRTP